MTLYSSILVRLSVCGGVSPVPFRHSRELVSHLQSFRISVLTSLQITKSGNKLDDFLPLKGGVIVAL